MNISLLGFAARYFNTRNKCWIQKRVCAHNPRQTVNWEKGRQLMEFGRPAGPVVILSVLLSSNCPAYSSFSARAERKKGYHRGQKFPNLFKSILFFRKQLWENIRASNWTFPREQMAMQGRRIIYDMEYLQNTLWNRKREMLSGQIPDESCCTCKSLFTDRKFEKLRLSSFVFYVFQLKEKSTTVSNLTLFNLSLSKSRRSVHFVKKLVPRFVTATFTDQQCHLTFGSSNYHR